MEFCGTHILWQFLVFNFTFRFLVGNGYGILWYFQVLVLVLFGTLWYFSKKTIHLLVKKWNYLLLFRTSKLLNWDFVEIFGTLVNTELRFSGIKWYFNK